MRPPTGTIESCARSWWGLRLGGVFVSGSRRYADPATYLYAPKQWARRQAEFRKLVGEDSSLHREPGPQPSPKPRPEVAFEAAFGVARLAGPAS
jgi:hypothetical protein